MNGLFIKLVLSADRYDVSVRHSYGQGVHTGAVILTQTKGGSPKMLPPS